jgi:hypothetical protein
MSLIYQAITDPATIKAAHESFKSTLQANSNTVPNCKLGFRGGNDSTDIYWHEDQKLWYGYQPTLSRHWNAFGTSRREPRPESALNIICEINIPHKSRDKSVHGVFVTDRTDNDKICIAHQGKLTITARKVLNIGFIDWVRSQPGSDQYLIDILWDEGMPEKTEAIMVTDLSNPLFRDRIKAFVLMANKYKEVIQGVTHKKSTD